MPTMRDSRLSELGVGGNVSDPAYVNKLYRVYGRPTTNDANLGIIAYYASSTNGDLYQRLSVPQEVGTSTTSPKG